MASRLAFTCLFAAALVAFVYGVLEGIELATSWNVMLLAFAGFFAVGGFLAGQLWALWLAPLAWLVFLPTGSVEALGLALVIGVPVAVFGLLAGIAVRRIGRRDEPH